MLKKTDARADGALGPGLVTDWKDVPLVLDIKTAARILRMNPDYLKQRCSKGTFPAFKEGGKWLVTKAALRIHVGDTGQTGSGGA
jgi:hypothetical protein